MPAFAAEPYTINTMYAWTPQVPSETHSLIPRRCPPDGAYRRHPDGEPSDCKHGDESWVDLPGLDFGDVVLRQTRLIGERCLCQSGTFARFSHRPSLESGVAFVRVKCFIVPPSCGVRQWVTSSYAAHPTA